VLGAPPARNGSMMPSLTAVQAASSVGGPFDQLVASGSHTCAIKRDGTLWCWGRIFSGCSATKSRRPAYAPVQAALAGRSVSSGRDGPEPLLRAQERMARLWCWGFNGYGQLGDGTTSNSLAPVRASPSLGANVASVSTGTFHTLCPYKRTALFGAGASMEMAR